MNTPEERPHASTNACEHLRLRLLARGRADLAQRVQQVGVSLAEQIQREVEEEEGEDDGPSAA